MLCITCLRLVPTSFRFIKDVLFPSAVSYWETRALYSLLSSFLNYPFKQSNSFSRQDKLVASTVRGELTPISFVGKVVTAFLTSFVGKVVTAFLFGGGFLLHFESHDLSLHTVQMEGL